MAVKVRSLRRRISIAFLLFALGSTLFFATMAVVAVEGIEEHLVDQRLQDVAEWASPRHAGGMSVSMPVGVTFHHGDAIPASLRAVPPGVHTVHVDGIGLHVLAGQDALGKYVVVDHESDYEKIEVVVYSLFGVGFIGMLVLSTVLGGFIGARVVSPIAQLADAVRAGSDLLPLTERDDELGVLARAFAAHTTQLRSYLDRERFFTGDVSHELRTPLTVIIGAAEILVAQGEGRPGIAAPAARILRAANEAAECVRVLLLLARSPELIPHTLTDIETVARAESGRYHALVEGKPVELRYLGGHGFTVQGPLELCSAAIGNLIRNACQYTEHGHVEVRLQDRSVIVEDSGPGLPAAVRATVANGVAPAGGAGSSGTSIGLTLVRRICEYLGATLVFSDRPGGGSIFEIRFPAI
ncbi:MAG: sensor histidine kinase [Gammaproteobacteria bacterium]